MSINGTLRTLEMESYSQFTNQYILSVSSLLNAMSKRAANITGFKDASKRVSWKTTKAEYFMYFSFRKLASSTNKHSLRAWFARAVLVIIGLRSFCKDLAALGPFCLNLLIPQYGGTPRARLVRG